ncbi:DNA/RNA-binding protein Alba-like [Dillenia turbinata]|uniref:DNA/RNA-binding protein Alba-like n=1 Tax=Dillenia turbinata TaxID=194707 RepID=A0AAN8Z328_9MAGN
MDRYTRVEKPKAEVPINENEIRITTQGRMRNYISYATTLLQVLSRSLWSFHGALLSNRNGSLKSSLYVMTFNVLTSNFPFVQEKGSNEIILKAMGRAINKTVMISELIKRRIVGLHQNTSIASTDITDMWEPLEEGLLPLETTRHVSMITITLSTKELDTSSMG